MGLSAEDRDAVLARLGSAGAAAASALDAVVADDEQLRDLVGAAGDVVVAFTDQRVVLLSGENPAFDYGNVEVKRKAHGLGIEIEIDGDRLVLDLPRSTHDRYAIVADGRPPARAPWLPRHAATTPSPSPSLGSRRERPLQAARSVGHAPPLPPMPQVPAGSTSPPRLALPPGWHPDPSSRHWWRWWDGRDWTEHVADGGSPFIDPLPPR